MRRKQEILFNFWLTGKNTKTYKIIFFSNQRKKERLISILSSERQQFKTMMNSVIYFKNAVAWWTPCLSPTAAADSDPCYYCCYHIPSVQNKSWNLRNVFICKKFNTILPLKEPTRRKVRWKAYQLQNL